MELLGSSQSTFGDMVSEMGFSAAMRPEAEYTLLAPLNTAFNGESPLLSTSFISLFSCQRVDEYEPWLLHAHSHFLITGNILLFYYFPHVLTHTFWHLHGASRKLLIYCIGELQRFVSQKTSSLQAIFRDITWRESRCFVTQTSIYD